MGGMVRRVRARGLGALGAVAILASAGCGGGKPAGTSPVEPAAPAQELPAGVEITASENGVACGQLPQNTDFYEGAESPVLGSGEGRVPAQANIFGAGRDAPPSPGGGGGGVLPPVFELPPGESRVVTFPEVTGSVNPIATAPKTGAGRGGFDETGEHAAEWNGPEGDGASSTDVESLHGISGIVDGTNGMFLVGVFLTDEEPSSPAPGRLDFTSGKAFEELAPQVGQVFAIGDGEGRRYAVPDEASRLFLGFADAFLFEGCPGWYGNNAGYVEVSIDATPG